jgi:hypothetical protein
MKVTVYHRPHRRPEVIDCPNVAPEDAAWFEANNVKVSMEEDGMPGDPNFIVYGDIGLVDEDGEPDEIIVFSGVDSCEATLARLRRECEERKAQEMK